MIYKLTSCKRVIAKVFVDLDLKEGDHRIADMVEWCGEALLKIGAFPSLVTKITGRGGMPLLEVKDYQAQLPCDFHSLNFVSFSESPDGNFIPLRSGTGVYDTQPEITPPSAESLIDDTVPEIEIIKMAVLLFGWTYEQALAELNSDPDLKKTIGNQLLIKRKRYVNDPGTKVDLYTYVMTPNYIKTNIRNGYLMMSYQAVPVDENNYPMVPDNESFLEAIYWYIVMKMSYPEWRNGRLHTSVYTHAESKWNFYNRQAYANALMPDLAGMKSLINTWNRLIPNINEDFSDYVHLGQQQIVYNVNVNG